MSISMIATQQRRYGNRMLQVGEEFQVRGRSDARLLMALKRAVMAQADPPPQADAEDAPVEQPAPEPVAEQPSGVQPPLEDAGKVRNKTKGSVGTYRRRDLTPED